MAQQIVNNGDSGASARGKINGNFTELYNALNGTGLVLTNATGLPPVTGIVGWPTNSSGVLTNDGSGGLTWSSSGTKLTPTTEKTANYIAVAGDLVLCDGTISAFTVTIPTAPADGTRVGVKLVKPSNATSFTITVALGGSDHINRTTGPTSTTLTRLGRTLNFQYKASNSVWYVTESDEALERSVEKIFNVEYFGAVHDGKVSTVNDGTITSGTAILTSAAGAVFASTDVGKIILVSGAGAAGAPLKTTILTYTSPTQVTLAANASTSVTTSNIVWGTDDTAAIQAALNACSANNGGTVFAPLGIYIIDGALQSSVGGANPNCQIYFPQTSDANSNRIAINLKGEGSVLPGYTKISWSGTLFYSTRIATSGAISGVFGGIGPTGSYQAFGFNEIVLQDFGIRCYTNNGAHAPYISGFSGKNFATISIYNCTAYIDVPLDNSTTALGSNTYGFYVSTILNDGPNIVSRGCASGFEYGWNIGEHTRLDLPYAIGNYNNYVIWGSSFSTDGEILSHAGHTQIIFDGSSLKNVPVNITMHVENDARGKWFDSNTLFTDASNLATGVLRFTNTALSTLASTYTGGANLYLLPSDRYIANNSNTAGGYVNAAGFSAANNVNADFQISTGLTTSNDTKQAGLSLITNQTGTANAVGSFQVLNSSLGTGSSERRMLLDITTTNGATNSSLNYRYVLNAGSLVNIWQTAGTRFNLGVNTIIGGSGTLATSPTALLNLTQPVLTVSWIPTLIATPGASTGMTTATEFPNFRFDGAIQTAASGTTATQRNFWIKRVTYAGTSGTRTVTNPYGLYVEDAAAGTNGALTNNYAIGTDGSIAMVTAGNGLFVKEGTNATLGVGTLVAGTLTVNTTKAITGSRIFVTVSTPGGTQGFLSYTISSGTSFTVTSTNAADTSTFNWFIVQPTP